MAHPHPEIPKVPPPGFAATFQRLLSDQDKNPSTGECRFYGLKDKLGTEPKLSINQGKAYRQCTIKSM